MSEPVAPAPGADGGGNIPAGGEAPAVNPTAPAAPGTGTPPAPNEPELTADEQALKAEDDEWEAATDEIFPGVRKTKPQEDKKNEQPKPEKGGEKTPTDPQNPEAKKPDAEQKPGDDTGKQGEETPPAGDKSDDDAGASPEANARAARAASREYTAQVEAVKADVMKNMFADVPETLVDADGDPIRSIEDVMKLINPRTGESFTEEEAGMWLLSAQQQFNQQREAIVKQAEQIAELNLEIKDQADEVNRKYGEYLKANPEFRDELWAEFQETLVKDEKSGVITKMPVSLEKYYERNVGPRVKAAEEQEAANAQAAADQAEADKKAKEEVEAKKKQKRSDRSDIYAPNNQPETDAEDDEWDEAARDHFGANYPGNKK